MIIGLFESHFCVSLYFLWHKESHKEKILDMNIRLATLEIYVFDEMTERLCNVLHFLLMVLGFSWLGLQLHCWKQNRENEIGEVEVGNTTTFLFSYWGLFDLWTFLLCFYRLWLVSLVFLYDGRLGLRVRPQNNMTVEEFKMLEGDGTALTPLGTRAWARALRLQHGKV